MIKKFAEKNSDYFYFVFRVLIGLLFLLHGIMKIPMIQQGKLPLMGLMGLAMIIEVLGGAMIILGLFTRYVASISAIEMIAAFFIAHYPKGINPLANGGESAVLFFAAFLVLIVFGSRKFALDKGFKK